MTTKITIIYNVPTDLDTFERNFTDTKQLDLARALPGLERLESSRVWPKEDGSPAPAHQHHAAAMCNHGARHEISENTSRHLRMCLLEWTESLRRFNQS